MLLVEIQAGRLSLDEALSLIDRASVSVLSNLDRGTVCLRGEIELAAGRVQFTAAGLVGLHRGVYEMQGGSPASAEVAARLGLQAATRLKHLAGEFSFHNTLAYLAEKSGDGSAAHEHYQA